MQKTNDWTEEITPHTSLLDLKLRQVWRYRDLMLLFVRRDFVAQYKQTILGPLWHFIQPIITAFLFTFVFNTIAGISTEGVPPFLFYLSGITTWNYFARTLNNTSNTFVSNAHIFGKVYFPRLVMPLSAVISGLIAFAIQFGLFLIFLAYYYFFKENTALNPNRYILLTPLFLLVMATLGLGLGIIISSLTTRYRDLSVLIGFGVQLLMYISPVIYPISAMPALYRPFVIYNPIAPLIEGFRYAFLGVGTFDWVGLGISTLISVVIFLIGVVLFNRVERNFMDTI
jgi:lipopolysaccharide transport system permease protein